METMRAPPLTLEAQMNTDADRHSRASPPESGDAPWRSRPVRAGFVFLDLLLVLIILGFLAAVVGKRYYADFSGQARQQAARSALAEGYSRLKLATVWFIVENDGDAPQTLADLSPDHLNATESLGDYTVVYVQGSGEVIVEVYPGAATTGSPLAARAFAWP
jgi:type II secretory pathway pseudopilin PulG